MKWRKGNKNDPTMNECMSRNCTRWLQTPQNKRLYVFVLFVCRTLIRRSTGIWMSFYWKRRKINWSGWFVFTIIFNWTENSIKHALTHKSHITRRTRRKKLSTKIAAFDPLINVCLPLQYENCAIVLRFCFNVLSFDQYTALQDLCENIRVFCVSLSLSLSSPQFDCEKPIS